MERFVQIALDIVAGEDVKMQDQLIDLSELSGKYYFLLYQLDDATMTQNISTVLKLFEQTWESLKTHHDPLTLTVIILIIILQKYLYKPFRSHVFPMSNGTSLLDNYKELKSIREL